MQHTWYGSSCAWPEHFLHKKSSGAHIFFPSRPTHLSKLQRDWLDRVPIDRDSALDNPLRCCIDYKIDGGLSDLRQSARVKHCRPFNLSRRRIFLHCCLAFQCDALWVSPWYRATLGLRQSAICEESKEKIQHSSHSGDLFHHTGIHTPHLFHGTWRSLIKYA